jgi:NAD(P)-dependent dehydrogenase (short-subunit alcohol dehydrogenase family)
MEATVVVVTGAGRGIGRCVAQAYARKGARVVVAERDEESGRQTADLIEAGGGTARFVHTDVGIPDQIVRLMDETSRAFGGVDVLVNNAGFGRGASPYELSVRDWDEVIAVNLRGTFLCAREAARSMRQRGGGSIINIASTRALMSEPNSEAYAASKGGIVALTHALAASLSADRIRVNCISPGWIETGDYAALGARDHEQHLSRRVGRPEDIARACLFLSDAGNDFITGANLVVDGGMTRKMIYE